MHKPYVGVAEIDVVVPVFNKRRFLEDCLGSILRAAEAEPLVRVTVVDHGSTDGSRELAAELCAGRAVHLVREGGTIGALRNWGASSSTGPIISFLDCDCMVPISYFASLRAVFSTSDAAAAGCRVNYPTDGPWVERVWHGMHKSTGKDGLRQYINAGNVAVLRSAFERVGRFDETLVTGEDAELGLRLRTHGYRLWEAGALAVVHLDNPQTLRSFLAKEVWHGLGMFGTVRAWPVDLPVLATVLHAIALISAAWCLISLGIEVRLRLILAAAMVLATPILAVLYRAHSQRSLPPLLPGLVLYEVYFLGRIWALLMVLWRYVIQRAIPRRA